jgi:hypothetical protein
MKRHLRPATMVGALLLLAACGPGTGGTGVAPGYLEAAGADAAPVCAATWADELRCPAPQDGLAPQLFPGTTRVQFASAMVDAEFVASIEGNRIEWHAACPRQDFVGDWGVLASGEQSFFGGWVGPNQVDAVAARMNAAPVGGAEPAALLLELRGADGGLLLGPMPLTRVTGTDVVLRTCQ